LLLEQAGLSVILLKGGALAYTHYPEPHLRVRVDTDIFINSADIRQIKAVFTDLGQQPFNLRAGDQACRGTARLG
jgi:hypothetical protein